jgi:hypothetical protein
LIDQGAIAPSKSANVSSAPQCDSFALWQFIRLHFFVLFSDSDYAQRVQGHVIVK